MNIYGAINALLDHAETNGLCQHADRIYCRNRLLSVLGLDSWQDAPAPEGLQLEEILAALLNDAAARGLVEDGVTFRDLFDTKLMDCLLPRPSQVIADFHEKYALSPKEATDWYYAFSRASDYIRTYRIRNDIKWKTPTPYGDMDITINLSKPEKDPRAIKLAGMAKAQGEKYPACLLCCDNEGYAGRVDHPARNNHRIIPIKVNGEDWFFQYSPYVYFNEHSIFLNSRHIPMKIDRSVFVKLFDIIDLLPHYFVGSNAGLPIVGGSILAHEHFQGGNYTFAMAKAPVETPVTLAGYEDVSVGIVKWPMSVVRLNGADRERVTDLADAVLTFWKGYSDPSAMIYAETDGEPHNTVTPITRKRDGNYEVDLVLRNNLTTEEYPDGLYHAHPEHHHIKRENIGLIEVMGLAVLPARLKKEMEALAGVLLSGGSAADVPELEKHAAWAQEIVRKHPELNADNVDQILRNEIGLVFCAVLENCGMFKNTPEGKTHLNTFITAMQEAFASERIGS